jgi:5-hydroxyisourate hydrolase-like protein (transthyretin family)
MRAAVSFSVHVSDATYGRPAEGVPLRVRRMVDGAWTQIWEGRSDEHGDISGCPVIDSSHALMIELDLREYFSTLGVRSFFSVISTVVLIPDQDGYQRMSVVFVPYAYVIFLDR